MSTYVRGKLKKSIALLCCCSLASSFTLYIKYCTHGMVEANKVNGICQQVLADVQNIVL